MHTYILRLNSVHTSKMIFSSNIQQCFKNVTLCVCAGFLFHFHSFSEQSSPSFSPFQFLLKHSFLSLLRLRLIYMAIKTIKTEFRNISQPLCDRILLFTRSRHIIFPFNIFRTTKAHKHTYNIYSKNHQRTLWFTVKFKSMTSTSMAWSRVPSNILVLFVHSQIDDFQ